jgi:hypothetical protein
MKAKILEIQNQAGTQINVIVEYYDDEDNFIIKRVLMFPEEKYYSMSEQDMIDFIKQEGDRHAVTARKTAEFNNLTGRELKF